MQPTSQPKKTVPSFGKHIFAIGVALIVVLAIVFMFSSRQGKSDLAAQLFPISIGPSSSNSVSLICTSNSPISIKVTSPNGGQTFQAGQPLTVTWSSCKMTASNYVNIVLSYTGPNGTTSASLGNAQASAGSALVSLPSANLLSSMGMQTGKYFKITLTNLNALSPQAYSDSSDSTFTITTSIPQTGITVSPLSSPTISVTPAGGSQVHGVATYMIPFAVTANGQDAYIPYTAQAAAVASATNKIQFCVDATTACAAAGTGVVTYSGSNGLTPSTYGTFRIAAGQTENFQVVITYQPSSAISTRASLLNVNWSANDATSGGTWNTYTTGLSSNAFKTPYAAVQ